MLWGVSCHQQSLEDLHQLGYHLEGGYSLVWAFSIMLCSFCPIPTPLPLFLAHGLPLHPPFESA